MASLWKAIRNRFRAAKDDAAQAVDVDEFKHGEFAIEDSENACDDFERKVANVVAQRKGLERQIQEAREEANKFGNIAKQAAAANNRDDAREALTRKANANGKAEGLSKEIETTKATEQQLRALLESTRARIAKAKSTHAVSAARLTGAKVRKAALSDASSFGSSLAALDDLENQASRAEDEAEALEEMKGTGQDSLEVKYDAAAADVDDELEALMSSNK